MTSARPPATPTLQIDNDRVRVTHWRFAPGEATGWHRHEYDYVIVPLTTGSLSAVDASGETHASPLTAGVSYSREAESSTTLSTTTTSSSRSWRSS